MVETFEKECVKCMDSMRQIYIVGIMSHTVVTYDTVRLEEVENRSF